MSFSTFILFRPMSQIHESHGGHDAINVRLTGGRNIQEGKPYRVHITFFYVINHQEVYTNQFKEQPYSIYIWIINDSICYLM